MTLLTTLLNTTEPAANGLTDLAAVRAHLQLQSGQETEQDPVLQDLIARMSRVIINYCQREFVAVEEGDERVIELDEGARLQSLAPYDCRSLSGVVLDAGLPSERTLQADEYRLALRDPKSRTWMALRSTRAIGGGTLTLTGEWGYATVPEDVELACILGVAFVVRSEVQAFGSAIQPNSLGDGVNDDQPLPPGIRGLLKPHRRVFYR